MVQVKMTTNHLVCLCLALVLFSGPRAYSKSVCARTKEVRLAISLALKKNCALITSVDLAKIQEFSQ